MFIQIFADLVRYFASIKEDDFIVDFIQENQLLLKKYDINENSQQYLDCLKVFQRREKDIRNLFKICQLFFKIIELPHVKSHISCSVISGDVGMITLSNNLRNAASNIAKSNYLILLTSIILKDLKFSYHESISRFNAELEEVFEFYCKTGQDLNATEQVQSFQEKLNNRSLEESQESEDSSYFALVAPRLTGKTLFCHSIRSHKVLFFASSQYELPKTQNIYKYYESLSRSFDQSCMKDLNGNFNIHSSSRELLYIKLSVDSLKTEYLSCKFYFLGFLHGLLQVHNFGAGLEPGREWLHAFANTRSFGYLPMSIEEFKNIPQLATIQKTFILVLDEFVHNPHLIFARNVCRAVGIVCLLSTTRQPITIFEHDRFSDSTRSEMSYSPANYPKDTRPVVTTVTDVIHLVQIPPLNSSHNYQGTKILEE